MALYRDAMNEAVHDAFRAHNAVTGLSNDEPDEVQVWHLILTLLEFCDATTPHIDFDAQVEDARNHMLTDATVKRIDAVEHSNKP